MLDPGLGARSLTPMLDPGLGARSLTPCADSAVGDGQGRVSHATTTEVQGSGDIRAHTRWSGVSEQPLSHMEPRSLGAHRVQPRAARSGNLASASAVWKPLLFRVSLRGSAEELGLRDLGLELPTDGGGDVVNGGGIANEVVVADVETKDGAAAE